MPLTLPLKSLPSEQEVVSEVSVCWSWGILCKILKLVLAPRKQNPKTISLHRDKYFLTSLGSRIMHNEVLYLEQNIMGNAGDEEEEKCPRYFSCFFYCPCP